MKTLGVLFGGVVLWVLTAHAVTVNGVATLSGQGNYSGTKVLFRAVSPSAQTDSTLTYVSGEYQINLQPGAYDVEYSHEGYALYRLPNQILLYDTALDSVLLMPPLSGYLSGTLGPGDFQVTDSIVVAANTSLTILPGTRLWFDGMHTFIVRGLLDADGTTQDSIVFTRRYSTGPDSMWSGMVLSYCNSQTRFDCVRLEYAYYSGGWSYASVLCEGSDVTITSCTFLRNRGTNVIRFEDCSPTLVGCRFEHNSGQNGVLYWYYSNPTITACTFSGNGGIALTGYRGTATISFCQFQGDGVALRRGFTTIEDCVFRNTSLFGGDAITTYDSDSVTVSRCTFHVITRAATIDHSSAVFSSCAILAFGYYSSGVRFIHSEESQVRYCDILATYGPFSFYDNDPSNGPPAIGQIALTNANGDSCDTYYNIFADPQFVDTANGDYHLLPSSPCIDAGDPQLPNDPDGTVADIGAYYFNQLRAGDPFVPRPASFTVSAYPNPFNATTTLSFVLPQRSAVKLTIFDLTGRQVQTATERVMESGTHTISFDAASLPSGLYFARLEAGATQLTQKLMLLR